MTQLHCQYCPCLCFDQACALALASSGEIVQITPSFAEVLGYRQEELQGQTLFTLLPQSEHAKAYTFLKALTHSSSTLEVHLMTKTKVWIPAKLAGCQKEQNLLLLAQIGDWPRYQRELLLREVHHRIKNNLQGIAGLLYNQALAHPELAPLLETPIRQINSIALLYGLKSGGEEKIFLCQLCQIIAMAGQGLTQTAIHMDIPYFKTIEVQDEEAVTLALILNELLANAIKHSQGPITFSVRKTETEAQVILRNPNAQPLKFDLAKGIGLGTGLQLVRQLLPPRNLANLTISWQNGEVVATLHLYPPLVRLLA